MAAPGLGRPKSCADVLRPISSGPSVSPRAGTSIAAATARSSPASTSPRTRSMTPSSRPPPSSAIAATTTTTPPSRKASAGCSTRSATAGALERGGRGPGGRCLQGGNVTIVTLARTRPESCSTARDRRRIRIFAQGGQTHDASADDEVILAGGAYNSPQLLMLSGIGPADALQRLGIAPRLDLPGVGQNLWNHPSIAIYRLRAKEGEV